MNTTLHIEEKAKFCKYAGNPMNYMVIHEDGTWSVHVGANVSYPHGCHFRIMGRKKRAEFWRGLLEVIEKEGVKKAKMPGSLTDAYLHDNL